MKTKIIIAFIALATSVKAQDTTNFVSGPHGGQLKTIENYKIETLPAYGVIAIYVFDQALKPVPNRFVSGNIMFYYDGEINLNKYLQPTQNEGYTVAISNATYRYYLLNVKIKEKNMSLRFDNLSGIAVKEVKKTFHK